jgi:predicted amidophosphoribosyltransferase
VGILDDLANLLLPAKCVLCDELPKSICDRCWRGLPLLPHCFSKAGFTGFALAEYANEIADVLNAFKERGEWGLGKRLTRLIPKYLEKPDATLLLSAPSSAINFANRGYQPARLIAETLAAAWHLPAATLNLRAGLTDQGSLDRKQRLTNLAGAMSSSRPLHGQRVVLVDDIVTTGATIAEMGRAAEEAGARVLGFIALAETIPKNRTRNQKKV